MVVTDSVLSFLYSFGVRKEYIFPFVILSLILYICFYKKVHKSLRPIKNAIVEIQGIFTQRYGLTINYNLMEAPRSELKPTEYGMTLIKESGLFKFIEENKNKLIKEVEKILEKSESKTSYDIQEISREVMLSYKDSRLMEQVKIYAFENALTVDMIFKTGGLILRDLYFDKHKKKK